MVIIAFLIFCHSRLNTFAFMYRSAIWLINANELMFHVNSENQNKCSLIPREYFMLCYVVCYYHHSINGYQDKGLT